MEVSPPLAFLSATTHRGAVVLSLLLNRELQVGQVVSYPKEHEVVHNLLRHSSIAREKRNPKNLNGTDGYIAFYSRYISDSPTIFSLYLTTDLVHGVFEPI